MQVMPIGVQRASAPSLVPLLPYIASISLVVFIALSVWPGFMSWDSHFALNQARNGITPSAYPPMMSYLWRLTEMFIPGPGGLLVLHLSVLLLALAYFTVLLRMPALAGAGAIVAFAATPIILGPMLVVWKDVGMSAFLMAGLAFLVAHSGAPKARTLVAAIACLAIGAGYRLNAFPAVVPLIAWHAWTLSRGSVRERALRSGGRTGAMTGIILCIVLAQATWRLPDLKTLPLPVTAWWTQLHDIHGISVCSGQALVPPQFSDRPLTVDVLKRIYHPEHVQNSFNMSNAANSELFKIGGFDGYGVDALQALWKKTVEEHPGCYLVHRVRVMTYALGANSGSVFYVTHPSLDENENGLKLQPTALTHAIVHWVTAGAPQFGYSDAIGARLWLLMLAGGVAVMYVAMTNRELGQLAGAIYASGVAYMLGNAFVIPAADGRYHHWTAICSFLCLIVALTSWLRAYPHPRARSA